MLFRSVDHYYFFAKFYMPEATSSDPDKGHYAGWVNAGALTVTDGNVLDYAAIEADVFDDADRHTITVLGYDPWGATQTAVRLSEGRGEGEERAHIPVVEIPQTVAQLSEPMKWLEGLILDGRAHHTGDPVLAWCISNVTAKVDAKDNVYPRKERRENKIDGAVAAIMALGLAMEARESSRSVYEERGLLDRKSVV